MMGSSGVRIVHIGLLASLMGCGTYIDWQPGTLTGGNAVSCQSLGKNCGRIQDGNGGFLECGTCADDEVCGADGIANVCCTPTTCAEQSANCGMLPDGCGGVLECGTCGANETCGGTGLSNVCGGGTCTPVRCVDMGLDCGTISDGCGSTLPCGTCTGMDTCGGSGTPNVCGHTGIVIPADTVEGCFGWPETDFTPTNFSNSRIGLPSGAQAIDFTLRGVDGMEHTLSELLVTKPVLIELGSYTCPVFQQRMGGANTLMQRYGDRVHFVIVYTIEAHPAEPDVSPYRGRIWTQEYSMYRQPMTYAARMAPAQATVTGGQLMLIDDLGPGARNPVWCTYGPAPNSAFLVGQDGTIEMSQLWFDPRTMEQAIQAVLSR
jgi:hypothetical protein